jgi:hypothetical protein
LEAFSSRSYSLRSLSLLGASRSLEIHNCCYYYNLKDCPAGFATVPNCSRSDYQFYCLYCYLRTAEYALDPVPIFKRQCVSLSALNVCSGPEITRFNSDRYLYFFSGNVNFLVLSFSLHVHGHYVICVRRVSRVIVMI